MTNPVLVFNDETARSLASYLYSKTRKFPVAVITQRRDNTGPCIKAPQFQDVLGSLAKVYVLSGGIRKQFNYLMENFYGIEPTGVRLYLPNMKSNDAPSRHKVWNERKIDTGFDNPEQFMEEIRQSCAARAEFVKSHPAHDGMSFEKADTLLFGRPKPQPVAKHPRVVGRKVLTLAPRKPTAPSPEALAALCDKFKHA